MVVAVGSCKKEAYEKMSAEKKTEHKRRTWKEVKAAMPPVQRKKVEVAALEMEREIALSELLEHLRVTQCELAQRMHTTQPQISRMLRRENIELQTLKRVAESVDGKLEISICMKDGERVSLAI